MYTFMPINLYLYVISIYAYTHVFICREERDCSEFCRGKMNEIFAENFEINDKSNGYLLILSSFGMLMHMYM
jgi:hypothetical protein